MIPNVKTAPLDQLYDPMASLERSSKSSQMAQKVANCEARVLWFRRQPRLLKQLLGGQVMLTLLEACYDIALEDYIQETNQLN